MSGAVSGAVSGGAAGGPPAGAGRRDPRSRRLLRAGLVLAVLGAVALALGAAFATVWRVGSTATSEAEVGGAAAAVTAPGVLEAREGPVVVEAAGEGAVTLAVGREADVTAWLQADPAVPAARLTGFDPETAALSVEAPEGAAAADPPAAQGSDLWLQEASGEGSATLTYDGVPASAGADGAPEPATGGGHVLLATSAGGELASVSLTWPVVVADPAAVPLLVAGSLLVLGGLALLVLARRGSRGPRAPRGGAEDPAVGHDAGAARSPVGGSHTGDPATATPGRGAEHAPVAARAPRALRTAGLLALVALPVAGCAAEPLQPRPPADAGPGPAVTAAQLDRIIDGPQGVAVTVAAADLARDPSVLAARLDGAALAVRQADYTVAAAAVGADPAAQPVPPLPIGGERLVEAVPAAGEWPRFVVTVSEPAASAPPPAASGDDAGVLPEAPQAAPVLEVLAQADPRAAYELVASAALLPGATFPELPQNEGSVEAVDPAGGDLRLSPVDALAHYADVLTSGTSSAFAGEFAPDAFTAGVLAEQAAEASAGAQYLTRTAAHAPREGEVWAVRTADGGAVVVGVLDATRTFAANTPGVSLTLPPDVAALGGRASATGGSLTAAETVVLTVPPSGSDAPLAVVGAERALTAVTLT